MTTSATDSDPQTGVAAGGHYVDRLVRPWDVVCHDPTASSLERETALLIEWNKTLTELRRLEAEVAKTLSENAHLAGDDDCTLARLKRAIGWANIPLFYEAEEMQAEIGTKLLERFDSVDMETTFDLDTLSDTD